MSEDLISLKMLIVSEVAAERDLLRQAAVQASVPIDVSELEGVGDAVAMGELLARERYDMVFFDSRIAEQARQELIGAIRAAPGRRPLAVLVGPAAIKTREVFTQGLEVDSTLAKPIDVQKVRDAIDVCLRARLLKRVLIVDDSSTVRSVVRKVLQASHFNLEIAEAPDGATATAAAAKQRFDLVFLDCEMPVIDGFAALEALRRAHPAMKVVMTGMRDVRIEDRARACGAEGFLYKPFFSKDIEAALNRLFGLKQPK
jgi:CheY-like chemotaxis protein